MKHPFTTEQENFWTSDFGLDYIERNQGEQLLASNLAYFSKILDACGPIQSIFEVGANVGMNVMALQKLLPYGRISALEINSQAAAKLREILSEDCVFEGSILDYNSTETFDLVFTKGVLIHISPDHLATAYQKLAESSKKYVLIGEYYNPTPVCLDYRGHQNKLFKRDFCGDFLDAHPEFSLVDYGFAYWRDPKFPQDDITWFLLGK